MDDLIEKANRANRKSRNYGGFGFFVADALQRFPLDRKLPPAPRNAGVDSFLERVYATPFLPIRLRVALWEIAHRSRVDRRWMHSFTEYYGRILGGRPLLSPEDIFWLRSYYRIAFTVAEVKDGADAKDHSDAYNSPELIYFLFHQVLKEVEVHQTGLIAMIKRLHGGRIKRVLEYGSAIGPITKSWNEFHPKDGVEFHLTDVIALPLHYAAYRFARCGNIKIIPLLPEHKLQITERLQVDVIFCITVFEHMNDPVETVKRFTDFLPASGLLVFDYIKSDGGGMDTKVASEARGDVLKLIDEHFDIIFGHIDYDNSMSLTVARKR